MSTGGTEEYGSRKRIFVAIFSQPHPSVKGVFCKVEHNGQDVDTKRLKDFFQRQYMLSDKDIKLYTKSDAAFVINKFKAWGGDLTEGDPDYQNEREKNLAESYDYFFFVFLGYLDKDGTRFQLHDISLPMDDVYNNIKTLKPYAGKPKVFLVQADDANLIPCRAVPMGDEERTVTKRKIPQDADRLIIQSTVPQILANVGHGEFYRQYNRLPKSDTDPTKGTVPSQPDTPPNPSFLIQAFLHVMTSNDYAQEDLLTRTCRINDHVRSRLNKLQPNEYLKNETLTKLTVPMTTSTMTKLVNL